MLYVKHLNKHNVVYLQLNELPDVSTNVTYDEFINRYKKLLFEDIQELWPNINIDKNNALSDIFNKNWSNGSNSLGGTLNNIFLFLYILIDG